MKKPRFMESQLSQVLKDAEAGVPVAPRVAFDWQSDAETLQGRARDHYLFNGTPPKIGQMFRAPGQAEVLRRIAKGGRDAFFTLWSQKESLMKALGCGWADGQIQRRTRLQQVAFQNEPATGASIWSRRILDGSYALAVSKL